METEAVDPQILSIYAPFKVDGIEITLERKELRQYMIYSGTTGLSEARITWLSKDDGRRGIDIRLSPNYDNTESMMSFYSHLDMFNQGKIKKLLVYVVKDPLHSDTCVIYFKEGLLLSEFKKLINDPVK